MSFIAKNHEQSGFTSPLPTPYWSAIQSSCVSRTVSTDSNKQPNSSRSNSSEEGVVEGSKKPTTVDLSDVVAKVRNHLKNSSFGCAKYSQVGGFNYTQVRERLREPSRTKFDRDTDQYGVPSDIRRYSEPTSSRQHKYILMQNGNALHSLHYTKTKSFTEDMPTVHVPLLYTSDAFKRLSSNTEPISTYDVNMGHPAGRSCLEGFTFRVWCAISAAIGWIFANCAGGTPTATTERKWNGAGLLETFL